MNIILFQLFVPPFPCLKQSFLQESSWGRSNFCSMFIHLSIAGSQSTNNTHITTLPLLLTLTAVQASLHVTEDSSFSIFCNRGMQSTKEKRFPKKKNFKKIRN